MSQSGYISDKSRDEQRRTDKKEHDVVFASTSTGTESEKCGVTRQSFFSTLGAAGAAALAWGVVAKSSAAAGGRADGRPAESKAGIFGQVRR